MSKKIKFAALYPEHLDLNGDHANLLVLQMRLAWREVEAEIIVVDKPRDLSDFDLILVGHGTKDAWAAISEIDADLIEQVTGLIRADKPVLAISSGYEKLILEMGKSKIEYGERVSEFREKDGFVGYVNSEAILPEIDFVKNAVLTLFHGPVLAKNPKLADQMIEKAGWVDVSKSHVSLRRVETLAEQSRKIAFED